MRIYMKQMLYAFLIGTFILSFPFVSTVHSLSDAYKNNIYNPGILKPKDSILKVKVGKPAPGFTLKAVSGEMISLEQYRGKKNVIISFVPAAWTPVCSDQWPGYNIAKDIPRLPKLIRLALYLRFLH